MNDKRDQHDSAAVDAKVAAHYKLIADEAVPPELERMVLHKARAAARNDGRQFPFMAWLRPAVFVATAGLSLALVIELNETGFVIQPSSSIPEAPQPAAVQDITPSTADDATGNRTAADIASALRREKSLATVSSKVTVPDAAGNDDGLADAAGAFDEAIENAGNRLRDQEVSQALATNAQSNRALPLDARDPASRTSDKSAHCSDEQKSDVEQWWRCVELLRRAGMSDVAESELESLQQKYPDFVAPE